jgi:inosine-uridine nucleoside N-ribohydrolase
LKHHVSFIDHAEILSKLKNTKLGNHKKIIIDTDAYNSIDDQFALVHMLLSEKIRSDIKILGITATPFYKELRQTTSYEHGMELSYEEIYNVIDTLDFEWNGPIKKGSSISLDETNGSFVESEAADFICNIANSNKENDPPIYVLALGALTNIASAILKDPSIRNNIVVCTLGGVPFDLYGFNDFNYQQDISSAKFIFSCGVPLVHFPTFSVTEQLRTSKWELKANLNDKLVSKFLYNRYVEFVDEYPGSNKPIWDLAPGAWVINSDWFISKIIQTKEFTTNNTWTLQTENHPIRSVLWVNRDKIFKDFFNLINK